MCSQVFQRMEHYFPEIKSPQVFSFSSGLLLIENPVIWQRQDNRLFIDTSSFLGKKNPAYKGIPEYLTNVLDKEFLSSKTAGALATALYAYDPKERTFLDKMIYEGKILSIKKALLPNTPDRKLLEYNTKQWDWAEQNEAGMYNYFVEKNYIYSVDPALDSRFLQFGPFSKFYTETDNETSPSVGKYIGFKICQKFLNEHPEVSLKDFLKMPAQEIFNQAKYKPKDIS